MKKIWIWMLCAALIMSNLYCLPAFAAEEGGDAAEEVVQDQGAEEKPEAKPEKKEEKKEVKKEEKKEEEKAEEAPVRKITASRSNISFGSITEGDKTEPETFSITNEGNVPAYITWDQADADGAFEIEALTDADAELEPGKKVDFQVRVKDVGEGDYTANIVFSDGDDPAAEAVVTVTVKVKEKEKEPEPETEEVTEEVTKEPETEEVTDAAPEKTTEKATEEVTEATEDTGETETDEPPKGYSVLTYCEPEEGGFVSGDGFFAEGDNALLVAFPLDGYTFDGWYVDDQLIEKGDTLNVEDIHADLTYIARFKRVNFTVKVTTRNKDYGTVSGEGNYKQGDSATLTAKPAEGYTFDGWYEDNRLVSKKSTYEVTGISADHTFIGVFKPEKHSVKVTVTPKEGGKVTGSGKYNHNSDVKFTAKASKGYKFDGYYINKKKISSKTTFTLKKVTQDVSVTARFVKEKAKVYEITSGIANKGGTISPSGKTTVEENASITYTFAPKNGYAIQQVSVDGKKIGAVKSYTFKNVKKDHRISVAFAPKKNNEKGVKKDKIITEAEAKKAAVDELKEAADDSQGRSSDVITPEDYAEMKKEGTLEDALKIPEQTVVGMDDAQSLPKEVDDYNYDEAEGICQKLDITPEQAKEMIESGDDENIIRAAYETGCLVILVNNQFLTPGEEETVSDVFEDDTTVHNMLEFVRAILTPDDELLLVSGKRMAVTLAITKGGELTDDEKKAFETAGADVDEYFHMDIVKKEQGGHSQIVTELKDPVEVTLQKPADSSSDCVIRVHDGKAEVLADLDDAPDTITIKTDKFSPYAFGTQKKQNGSMMPLFIGGAAIVLIAAIATVILSKRKEK